MDSQRERETEKRERQPDITVHRDKLLMWLKGVRAVMDPITINVKDKTLYSNASDQTETCWCVFDT